MAGKRNSTKPATKKKVEDVAEVKTEVEELEDIEVKTEAKPVLGRVANCAKVRLRETPEMVDNVIDVLDADAEFEVLDNSNPGWTRVKVQDRTGWIMSDYVKLV